MMCLTKHLMYVFSDFCMVDATQMHVENLAMHYQGLSRASMYNFHLCSSSFTLCTVWYGMQSFGHSLGELVKCHLLHAGWLDWQCLG